MKLSPPNLTITAQSTKHRNERELSQLLAIRPTLFSSSKFHQVSFFKFLTFMTSWLRQNELYDVFVQNNRKITGSSVVLPVFAHLTIRNSVKNLYKSLLLHKHIYFHTENFIYNTRCIWYLLDLFCNYEPLKIAFIGIMRRDFQTL